MGPTGALSNSAKTHVKSCTWESEPLAVLRAGNGLVVGSSAEKFLEVIVGSKLSVSQQRAPATARATCMRSCRSRRRARSGNQEKCLFPFTCHSLDHYKTTLSSFGPLHTVKTLIKRNEYWSGYQHNWWLDSFPCEKKLRDQGLFILEKEVASGWPNIYMERVEKTEPASSQWCVVGRWETRSINWKKLTW